MGVFQERDRVVRDTAAGERRGLLDQLQNHARRIHELNGQMSEIGQRLVRLTSELANLGNGVAPDALEQQIAEVNSEFERAGNTLMMLTRAMARVNGRVRAIDSEEATRLRQLRQRRQRWQLDDRRKARSRESAMEHEERARAAREREAAAGGDVDEEAKEAE
jgi:chromosome segregation ATPase